MTSPANAGLNAAITLLDLSIPLLRGLPTEDRKIAIGLLEQLYQRVYLACDEIEAAIPDTEAPPARGGTPEGGAPTAPEAVRD